ncbi:hypothetical protein C3R30_21775, partial [Mycobacterium tuberculosis]
GRGDRREGGRGPAGADRAGTRAQARGPRGQPGEAPPEPGEAPAKARAEGGRGRERTGRGPGGEEPATKGDREQTSPEAAGGPTQAANRKGDGRTQHL